MAEFQQKIQKEDISRDQCLIILDELAFFVKGSNHADFMPIKQEVLFIRGMLYEKLAQPANAMRAYCGVNNDLSPFYTIY